jgi:hypothetical protein
MDELSESKPSSMDGPDFPIKFVASVRKATKDTIELKKFILTNSPNGIDHENIMDVIITSVRFLAKNRRKLTGQQKKKQITDALLLVLDETENAFLDNFESVIKLMVPTIVDNLIDVEKGKIKLNKGVRNFCCFC